MRCERCIEMVTDIDNQMYCKLFDDWCYDPEDMCPYFKERKQ